MRFIRVCRDSETGAVLAVIEQGVPFDTGGQVEIEGHACEMLDLGACEEFAFGGAPTRAAFIRERLEKHPLADTHVDAPKVRVKPEALDAPTIYWTPCSYLAIAEHLANRGRDSLPTLVCEALREHYTNTPYATARALRAIGYSFDQIKALPRFAEARAAAAQSAMNRQLEAERQAAEAEREAVRQARINRRLNKD